MNSPQRRKTTIFSIILILSIAWLLLIFNFSAMTSQDSNSKSTGLTEKLISKVLDATNEAGITDSHPDAEKLSKATSLINKPFRKVAHATVYFVLALILLALGRIIFGSKKYLLTCVLALLFCFIFAMTDEYHQTFVDGRTGQFSDVIIDTAGACIGILVFSSYYSIWKAGTHNKTNLHNESLSEE